MSSREHTEGSEATMYCPNCGNQVGDTAQFCTFCGHAFHARVAQVPRAAVPQAMGVRAATPAYVANAPAIQANGSYAIQVRALSAQGYVSTPSYAYGAGGVTPSRGFATSMQGVEAAIGSFVTNPSATMGPAASSLAGSLGVLAPGTMGALFCAVGSLFSSFASWISIPLANSMSGLTSMYLGQTLPSEFTMIDVMRNLRGIGNLLGEEAMSFAGVLFGLWVVTTALVALGAIAPLLSKRRDCSALNLCLFASVLLCAGFIVAVMAANGRLTAELSLHMYGFSLGDVITITVWPLVTIVLRIVALLLGMMGKRTV